MLEVFPKIDRLYVGDKIKFVVKSDSEFGFGATNECVECIYDDSSIAGVKSGHCSVVFREIGNDDDSQAFQLKLKVYDRDTSTPTRAKVDYVAKASFNYAQSKAETERVMKEFERAKTIRQNISIQNALTHKISRDNSEALYNYAKACETLYNLNYERVAIVGYENARKIFDMFSRLSLKPKQDTSRDKYYQAYYTNAIYHANLRVVEFEKLLKTFYYSDLLHNLKGVEPKDIGEVGYRFAEALRGVDKAWKEYKKLHQYYDFKKLAQYEIKELKELLYNLNKLAGYGEKADEAFKIANDQEETYYRRIT